MIKKCDCYEEYEETQYLTDFERGVYFGRTGESVKSIKVKKSRCRGTKECDECSCGGDRMKCNFYPEVRKEAEQEQKIGEAKKKLKTSKSFYIGCVLI